MKFKFNIGDRVVYTGDMYYAFVTGGKPYYTIASRDVRNDTDPVYGFAEHVETTPMWLYVESQFSHYTTRPFDY